jgi:hypothetical protein
LWYVGKIFFSKIGRCQKPQSMHNVIVDITQVTLDVLMNTVFCGMSDVKQKKN